MRRRYADVPYGSMKIRVGRVLLKAQSYKLRMIGVMEPVVYWAIVVG